MQVLLTTSISFLNERFISSALSASALLSGFTNKEGEGLLPAVHLDHLDPVDNLVHQSDSLVSLAGGLDSQAPKLFADPG